MNERFLHGIWRTVVMLLGLIIALASLYVLLLAVGVAPTVNFGTVEAQAVQENPPTAAQTPATPGLRPPPAVPSTTENQAALALETVQKSPLIFWLDLRGLPLPMGLLWMLGSVLGIILGVVLMALGVARVEGAGRTVVLRGLDGTVMNGSGRVTVSMRSLHALVTNLAERIEGVREVQTRLRLKRAGWHVNCTVAHAPETPLPEIAQALKQQIQTSLEHHTGLPVARIDIAGRLGLVDAKRRVH